VLEIIIDLFFFFHFGTMSIIGSENGLRGIEASTQRK
jgi:hypothetical protein